MANLIEQVKEQQEEIRNLQKTADRNSGKEEQIRKQLKDEFKIETREEAEELLSEFLKVKKENEDSLAKIKENLDEIIASAATTTSSGTTN